MPSTLESRCGLLSGHPVSVYESKLTHCRSAVDGDTGEGHQRGSKNRLVKGMGRGENAEEQQAVDGLARLRVHLAGENLVVIDAALAVDKDLQHHGIVMVADRVRGLEGGVKQAGRGGSFQG